MNVEQLAQKTGWTLFANDVSKNREVNGAFVGDLLSWVMGNSSPDQAWLTVQAHLNVIAVACLRDFSCIIFVQGVQPPQETLDKAMEEDLAILTTNLSAYEACCELHKLGV